MRTWAASLALLLTGCGDYKLAPLSGKITVEGKPVASLYVQFDPIGSGDKLNPGPASVGETDSAGHYRLRTVPEERGGAVVGKHRVRVIAGIKAMDEDAILKAVLNKKRAAQVKHLPARFNDRTELTFEVPAGGANNANFDLSWK